MNNIYRINLLEKETTLPRDELHALISTYTEQDRHYAALRAAYVAVLNFGKKIFYRGLIELTNYCKNDCYYCGIRRSNKNAKRYRLSFYDIDITCEYGYEAGLRSFVLQGGEDEYYNDDRLSDIVSRIKDRYPDCAITLSMGERSKESYQRLYDAGADRYLLRHETATEEHYLKLHPADMTLSSRKLCLDNLKEIGFQTGCGFMIGSPFQTVAYIVEDLYYMKSFAPHMIGIGPFIPHRDTNFCGYPSGSVNVTLFILSLIRLMQPRVLLPSTTALGTAAEDGRERGILAGANVVMPNISPSSARENYILYDNKIGTSDDYSESIALITSKIEAIGYKVSQERGDYS